MLWKSDFSSLAQDIKTPLLSKTIEFILICNHFIFRTPILKSPNVHGITQLQIAQVIDQDSLDVAIGMCRYID